MSTDNRTDGSGDTPTSGVFDALIGLDGAKAILRAALRSGDVHILLEGPPASGKSAALTAIEEHIPNTKYADAAGYTEVQLREQFAADPAILCLDEIDAMRNGAYEAMSMPMEQQRVTKNTARSQYDVEISTQVIAACNSATDLPAHTADRFRTVTMPEYTVDEYVEVCAILLPRIVSWVDTPDEAREVAHSVYDAIGSRSPRDARDVAKLAGQPNNVASIAEALEDPTAVVESDPITPDEITALRRNKENADSDHEPMSYDEWKERACPHLTINAPDDPKMSMAFADRRLNCPRCRDD